MEYKGLYVLGGFSDKGADSIFFQIYADEDYRIKLEEFSGTLDIDIEDNIAESVEEYIKEEIDIYLEKLKKEQIYALLNKEYDDFMAETKAGYKENDIINNEETIAAMKKMYEYLMKYQPLDSESIDYLLHIVHPLKTMCDNLQLCEMDFVQCIDITARNLIDQQIGELKSEDEDLEL